jgi:exodeoxyribonuclease VII large subunit
VTTATQTRVHRGEARLRSLEARPGYAGMRGRTAMRGRQAAELAHELRRALAAQLARRERRYQALRLQLETFDVRRRFGALRARLVAGDGRLQSGAARRQHHAQARLATAAARLDSLSPLAVLGRGYAVAWNADRTAIIRDAAAMSEGDRVHVTLERGELDCTVDKSSGRL